jgi:signal peptidase I
MWNHLNHVAQISMVLFEHTRQVLYTRVVSFFKVPSNSVKENANSPDLFFIGKIFQK